MEDRIELLEELVDDLKDELLILHEKYKKVVQGLNDDLDRLYNLTGIVR